MPAPTMPPITTMVASKRPRRRARRSPGSAARWPVPASSSALSFARRWPHGGALLLLMLRRCGRLPGGALHHLAQRQHEGERRLRDAGPGRPAIVAAEDGRREQRTGEDLLAS